MIWEFASHIPLLYEAVRMTDGEVVELGVGLASTPVLHAICINEKKRRIVSVDDNTSWLAAMKTRCVDSGLVQHDFVHVVNWTENLKPIIDLHPDVVFIDQGAPKSERDCRMQTIRAFAGNCKVLVAHDWSNILCTAPDAEEVLRLFRYRYLDQTTHAHTIWLSNWALPEFTSQKLNTLQES
jgi:hypothetical protein